MLRKNIDDKMFISFAEFVSENIVNERQQILNNARDLRWHLRQACKDMILRRVPS